MASKNILVVDDEIGIRELLRDILQDEGYQVQLAENAASARAIRLQERPDIVLLDIWMPDCDGITLLKEWANNSLLTMPVVMMSGHGTIDTAVEATRIGPAARCQELLQACAGHFAQRQDSLFDEVPVKQPKATVLRGELAAHGALGTEVAFDIACQRAAETTPRGPHSASSASPMASWRKRCNATLA